MLFEAATLYLLGGRSSKKLQRVQIAQAQQQLALQQSQHIMQEDLIAISAAPEAMRPQILQARIDARAAAARRRATWDFIKAIPGLIMIGLVVAFFAMLKTNTH